MNNNGRYRTREELIEAVKREWRNSEQVARVCLISAGEVNRIIRA